MRNNFLIFGAGAIVIAVLLFFAYRITSMADPIELFDDASPPTDWNPGSDGPLGNKPIKATRFVRLDDAIANKELYTKTPPFEVVLGISSDEIYRITIESVTEIAENLHSVSGSVKADVYGRANLVLTDKVIRGVVHVDNHLFELIPASSDVTVIAEISQERFPRENRPLPAHWQSRALTDNLPPTPQPILLTVFDGQVPIRNPGIPLRDTAFPATPEIRVLVVQTLSDFDDCSPDALDSKQALFEDLLNDAFNDIATGVVTFKCIDATPDWTSLEEGRQFVMNEDQVKSWRIEAAADLVVLLVKNGLGSCGYAMGPDYPDYPITDDKIDVSLQLDVPLPAEPSWVNFFSWYGAYAVVDDDCALDVYSFAHEVGHLMGMRHERFSEFGGVEEHCGYGYPIMRRSDPVGRTIMAYPGYCSYRGVDSAHCSRHNRYSFPLVKEPGFIGWIRWQFHKCFGRIFGQSCDAPGTHHLDSASHDENQLRQTATLVASYSDLLPPVGTPPEPDSPPFQEPSHVPIEPAPIPARE